MAANKLELIFSASKDAEIVRFLQLNTDEYSSPILICALEYYIKTEKFLKIGKVHIGNLTDQKVRKPIYVPKNSIVSEWAEAQKKARKGLLSSKVRYILKNSIDTVESEKDEKIEDYMDLLMQVDKLQQKTVVIEKPSTVHYQEVTVPYEPPSLGYTQEVVENPSEPVVQKSEKPKNRGIGLLDKMMPTGFDD